MDAKRCFRGTTLLLDKSDTPHQLPAHIVLRDARIILNSFLLLHRQVFAHVR
jgi:hypothetical protein